ncbi:hypothetical protein ES676_02175 [Bizionia saleffrena]|uniref:Lipoprotein n=1 Tax=Bizionia saleffrena TaxID=291189 RepID=A0A8H2LF91_9FLAO|nr:hypothetical protein [Bizionia saleffrena]TYB78044.1 hypothetical protein ES676_02175 [Bizionia saleffrena]
MKNLLLAFAMLLIVSNCNKNDDDQPTNPIDQLPPATQTGANTFGFLVNGEPINVTNTSQQTAIYQGGLLQFGAGGIFMLVQEPFTINTQNDLTGKARYLIDPNPQLGCHYELEDSYEGSVVFSKIDTDNFIISGTFQFSSVNNDCENVDITSGRFDLQYIP